VKVNAMRKRTVTKRRQPLQPIRPKTPEYHLLGNAAECPVSLFVQAGLVTSWACHFIWQKFLFPTQAINTDRRLRNYPRRTSLTGTNEQVLARFVSIVQEFRRTFSASTLNITMTLRKDYDMNPSPEGSRSI
jgi:hypothetical protein